MIARVEGLQAWLENVTYQMNNMVSYALSGSRVEPQTDFLQSYRQQAMKLAGQIAFLKMTATQTAQETAKDAVQLFGGRGITKTGMGRHIEHVSDRVLSRLDQTGLTDAFLVPPHYCVRRPARWR